MVNGHVRVRISLPPLFCNHIPIPQPLLVPGNSMKTLLISLAILVVFAVIAVSFVALIRPIPRLFLSNRQRAVVALIISLILLPRLWGELSVYPEKTHSRGKLHRNLVEKKHLVSSEEIRRKKIEKHFNPSDGSHRNLAKEVKRSMNNPFSFDHVDSRYKDMGSHIRINMTFVGETAFGVSMMQKVEAIAHIDGTIVSWYNKGVMVESVPSRPIPPTSRPTAPRR